ncbi:hypothetical protein C6P46_003627 [Rhodotorula mucilaginosa]|uniref:Uncharacterized protein n=1 Tax=Rhodotorula mucilaginosa TaxID=5537 RepID=A0A9P6W847_RHOMI|nr:hypothetical protein C6P46_003627 [Rhodotorula mucilaginosa]
MSSVDADDPWAPAPVAQPPQPDTDAEDSISPADIQAKEQLVKYAHPRPAGWVSDSRPHTYPPQEHHKQAGRTPSPVVRHPVSGDSTPSQRFEGGRRASRFPGRAADARAPLAVSLHVDASPTCSSKL